MPEDADRLADLWADVLRRVDREEQAADLRSIIERVAPLHDERLVVAEYDGQLAGAVHLRAATITPLNLEPVVQTISPHVFPEFRRHGVGRALMEASVAFAEELGIGHVATAVGGWLARREPVHGPARARPLRPAARGAGARREEPS